MSSSSCRRNKVIFPAVSKCLYSWDFLHISQVLHAFCCRGRTSCKRLRKSSKYLKCAMREYDYIVTISRSSRHVTHHNCCFGRCPAGPQPGQDNSNANSSWTRTLNGHLNPAWSFLSHHNYITSRTRQELSLRHLAWENTACDILVPTSCTSSRCPFIPTTLKDDSDVFCYGVWVMIRWYSPSNSCHLETSLKRSLTGRETWAVGISQVKTNFQVSQRHFLLQCLTSCHYCSCVLTVFCCNGEIISNIFYHVTSTEGNCLLDHYLSDLLTVFCYFLISQILDIHSVSTILDELIQLMAKSRNVPQSFFCLSGFITFERN